MKNHELILAGVHMELTDAIKNIVKEKMEKLFRHEEKIIRLRVEVEHAQNKARDNEFVAKGHIEIDGPDIIVAAASENLYTSIDKLVVKLDRKLRRRARLFKVKRKAGKAVEIDAALPRVG